MTTSVNGVSTTTANTATDAVKKVLGKDDFLKLLITQLKYQDPMEPTDNKDFIAQMAQFSSLEQMTNMSDGFQQMASAQESVLRELSVGQAVNMIGRTVSVVLPMDQLTGKTKVQTDIYQQASSDSQVLKTLPAETSFTVLGSEGQMLKVSLADGTVGFISQDTVNYDENTRITGVVTGMKLVDGVPNVEVNGKTYPISQIEQVNLTTTTDPSGGTATQTAAATDIQGGGA